VTRILVIDSDEPVARSLCVNLRTRQYVAQAVATGYAGLDLAGRFGADAVLLGLDLPDMSGLEVISGLRGWSTVPILATSQQTGELGKISVLDAGADDYVTKPFGMGELLARLRALLRRSQPAGEEPCVITDDFTIDLAARRITTAAGDVHLTSTEWRLVEVLVRNSGKVVTQKALLQEVWGPSYGTETQYLRVYLKQIRSKLEPTPCRPRYFLTHRGLGLRFNSAELGDGNIGATVSKPPPMRALISAPAS
jgi:two-component system, OmpR family, KDP operon response regulator KdpE